MVSVPDPLVLVAGRLGPALGLITSCLPWALLLPPRTVWSLSEYAVVKLCDPEPPSCEDVPEFADDGSAVPCVLLGGTLGPRSSVDRDPRAAEVVRPPCDGESRTVGSILRIRDVLSC